jgi:hypothetical protein
MERELKIGEVVVFIDSHRAEHKALVTCIHGDPQGRKVTGGHEAEDGSYVVEYDEPGTDWPCINLLIVSPNEDCQDQYGRQLERHTSVVHQSNSSAQGYCFRFEDEVLDPTMRQPTVS